MQQPTLRQLCHVAGHGRSWELGISRGTPEQVERVRAEGCSDVQSHLLSPPRPASEIGALIAADRAKESAVA
ncbi:MAG: hypothetical protein WA837_02165 [Xanthobacteraceae bacterium]